MKVLIVSAHPEPSSLTNALRNVAISQLEADGHEVRVSDLYAMNFQPCVVREDFPALAEGEPLRPTVASMQASATSAFTQDVLDEQEKVLWADAVIFAFPLWWFSVPAIMKGWIDRVWTAGIGYQLSGERYGAGRMSGKRAMIMVMIGGRETYFSAGGVNGPIDDLLFPITHGMLYYPGFAVLPSLLVYRTHHLDGRYDEVCDEVRGRMRDLFTTPPIPFRAQAGGDFDEQLGELKPEIAPATPQGFAPLYKP
ncbi:NAD(P)H-dependent oxidoreductase [Novosphingobium cyanobacteriorum]|uniref:NAD(P)H-dependent oxidoreductase n=1 Tax=Novosphingobium cyanobacteriorum TaxID=3024215 RepID=A0ABT6CNA1_9SPHN|nr:NAD(P)H-dependent oxidoreductase [Novosphingobium cyanobacteriorum]MDF8335390.1 NAD(P)H-dependent oxidoreductase [Novosphingobium cyanobacteriorum]